MKIPDSDIALVRGLVANGLTDGQIGDRYNASPSCAYSFRKRHGIIRRPGQANGAPLIETALQPEIYIDDSGLTVKRYPPRWALGAQAQRNVGSRRRKAPAP